MLVRALEAHVCAERPLGDRIEGAPRRAAVEPDVHCVRTLLPHRIELRIAQPIAARGWHERGDGAVPPVAWAVSTENGKNVRERVRVEDCGVRREVVKRRNRDAPDALAGYAPFRPGADERFQAIAC